jgi:hypothetical protein
MRLGARFRAAGRVSAGSGSIPAGVMFLALMPAKKRAPQVVDLQGFKSGAPERSRTPNLLIRSQALYPIELRALLRWEAGGN